jgi:hypothetical protein
VFLLGALALLTDLDLVLLLTVDLDLEGALLVALVLELRCVLCCATLLCVLP